MEYVEQRVNWEWRRVVKRKYQIQYNIKVRIYSTYNNLSTPTCLSLVEGEIAWMTLQPENVNRYGEKTDNAQHQHCPVPTDA